MKNTFFLLFIFLFVACGNSVDTVDTANTGGDTGNTGDSADTVDTGNTSGDTANTGGDTGDSADTVDAGNTSGDTANTGGDTADSGDTADTTPEIMPQCAIPCSTAVDCVTNSTSPIADADNHSCNDGWCAYTGCNSDAECVEAINAEYGCFKKSGLGSCVKKCMAVSDCVNPAITDGAYNEDNYACSDGYCEYTGCNITTECEESMIATGDVYVCHQLDGMTMKVCVRSCNTPVDCETAGMALYDAEHYKCEDKICMHQGCVTDSECADAMSSDKYDCKN